MNVTVKSVASPFSFFCCVDDKNAAKDYYAIDSSYSDKKRLDLSDVGHGQYVAVHLKDKWVRGVVSMERNFLIWLVDHGTYFRPTENTVYFDLPAEYKKLPSKVFEASIHGVTPIGLALDGLCLLKKDTQLSWSLNAMHQAQELIGRASSTYFVPIGMLSTKTNDIVLGDLYLQLDRKFTNLIDEMSPVTSMHMFNCMERNKEMYIKHLSQFYSKRRIHRACLLKPELPVKDLPTMTTETTLDQYNAICANIEPFPQEEYDSRSIDGSSVTYVENLNDAPSKKLKLTQSEIEKYSNVYIVVGSREYNFLTVLMNKARDLYICEKYKDVKSVGRATTRLKNCK